MQSTETKERLKESHLGKTISYDPNYNPDRVFPVERALNRKELGLSDNNIPFYGFDEWNHYELSWLNEKGKPVVALAQIIYSCATPNIIESKSMKLYFHSYNNTKFKNLEDVKNTAQKDIQKCVNGDVIVNIIPIKKANEQTIIRGFNGICLDDLDIECSVYNVEPSFLTTESQHVENETLYTDLLKSNCLGTQQPDWGSVQIIYTGQKINHEGLLKYIVSFRNHNEFGEHCVERIFMDISKHCQPEKLTVQGRYTRRGGIDLNPFRTSEKDFSIDKHLIRLCRQ